jgi:hypothetical protein
MPCAAPVQLSAWRKPLPPGRRQPSPAFAPLYGQAPCLRLGGTWVVKHTSSSPVSQIYQLAKFLAFLSELVLRRRTDRPALPAVEAEAAGGG